MVELRIRQDAELSAAWIPALFPEEQFNLISLRDVLAATLQMLAKQNVPMAQEWLDKVEAERNEEQSEQLAITGLREISRQTGKRFVLFIENLNHLLEDHLDDKMKGTLRRLLMSDPFMLIIGSTVHLFDALRKYDEAFFNYFGQVPLNRLDADPVTELLRKRAEYDQNERFLRELPKQQAKVRTLVHLTGGNPRFVLMLYELLSLQQVTNIIQQLKRLVDELTPLLKDEMENLPPQQRKIIHALMERGGTAQPTDLAGPTRLPLNAITTQLKRLKDAQIVDVLGGGKGRAANYTVPDKLFSLWYQMRYLGQNRRRIELFVEVLRVWFEADERIETLRKLADRWPGTSPLALRDCATTAEYLAASLKDSTRARAATELCVSRWAAADLHEAAVAHAGPTLAAFSDLLEVIRSGVTTDNLIPDAAALAVAISSGLPGDTETRTENVLQRFSAALDSMSHAQAREVTLAFLNALALPAMKEIWPKVFRRLIARLRPEVVEAIGFLEPACSVLEGEDRTLLDALPPEQREFALEVLARFEPKPKAEPVRAPKTTARKRTPPKKTRT
jgi:hypothetical protein